MLATTVDSLFPLDQITADQGSLVGSRALQLSVLVQKGYPVLPGFVVSAQCFREFLSAINWLEPFFADLAHSVLRLNVSDSQQLQTIAQQIRTAILSTPFPAAWQAELATAVKPFAAFSDAAILHPSIVLDTPKKQFDLNSLLETQICWQDAESLANSIRSLWAELFRARNILYWQKANLSLQQFRLAILVQAVASPLCSGYLQFNGTTWDVLATWGLETAIDRGEVMPDLYRIDAHTGITQFQKHGSHAVVYGIDPDQRSKSPLQRKVQSNHQSPVLSANQLEQIQGLIKKLSDDFDAPASFTWQLYESQLYLTQLDERKGSSVQPLPDPNVAAPSSVPVSKQVVSGLGASSGQVSAIAKVIQSADPLPQALPPETVVVTEMISPDWLPLLKQASAIVSEQGGMTSHGAIVARELGIPAIVGAHQATQRIQTGDRVLINGDTGKITFLPPLSPSSRSPLAQPAKGTPSASRPPVSLSMPSLPIATHLLLNLSQSDLIDRAVALPVDGVGLLRSELMMLTVLEQQHPQTWLKQNRRDELIEKLAAQIQKFAQAFAPRPVSYRTLDLRSHEFRSLQEDAPLSEPNPMLGLRGTFSYTVNPELFDLELAALNQVCSTSSTNLRLLLPFVRTVEEFLFCQRRIEQAELSLPLWIMAEVPSVLFLLPAYVKAGVQGICIGTNDLTQLLLGADRDQGKMANAFDVNHPVVLQAIAQLIRSAQTLNIACSICYPISAKADFVDYLIQLGVDAVSVDLDQVEWMYGAIARAEHRLLLKKARETKFSE